MVDDEAAGRAEAAGAEVGVVAVAGEDEQVGAFGGGHDFPFDAAGALDAVMALLRRLQSEGKTLLVVEHNTRVVQQIADEVLFLHQGHLMARGSPADIIADPALAEIYFGGAI